MYKRFEDIKNNELFVKGDSYNSITWPSMKITIERTNPEFLYLEDSPGMLRVLNDLYSRGYEEIVPYILIDKSSNEIYTLRISKE